MINDIKSLKYIPQLSRFTEDSKPYVIHCRITNRNFMYSYNTLIYILDVISNKYYFTKDYNRSVTTSKHRNKALGFTLTDKLLKEMIDRGNAEMI